MSSQQERCLGFEQRFQAPAGEVVLPAAGGWLGLAGEQFEPATAGLSCEDDGVCAA
jgi:hypothetical protein